MTARVIRSLAKTADRLASTAAYTAASVSVRACGGAGPAVRQEAIYLAVTAFGRPLRSVARVAGISAPGALKAVRAVEDRREDPRFDRALDELELELMG